MTKVVSKLTLSIALDKVLAGYRPGEEDWSEEDQAAVDYARGNMISESGEYETLAACPFCGESMKFPWYDYGGSGPPPKYALICDDCGAQGPSGYGFERDDDASARKEARRLWNIRTAMLGEPDPNDLAFRDLVASGGTADAMDAAPPEDALAAFERLLPMDDLTAPYGLPPNVDVDAWNRDREIVRRHLTASGVPEEVRRLRPQIEWLEANSVLRNPRQHPISEYLETKGQSEPVCPGSEQGVHSEAWYDGEQCSICGAPALATPPPESEPHPDDLAVNRFAEAMKAKLAKAREKGRGGWDDPDECTGADLARMLIDHMHKDNEGTCEDVANFAMMLHQRGEAPEVLARAWLEADKEASDRGYRYAMKAAEHPTPEQAHGDALAALRNLEAWAATASETHAQTWADTIRRHLTASGVPDHQLRNRIREIADFYRVRGYVTAEKLVEKLEAALASAPSDSGVPYVQESIRNLPELIRDVERAARGDGEQRSADRIAGVILTVEDVIERAPSAEPAPEAPHWADQALAHARTIRQTLEAIDNRCMHYDGDVGHTLTEARDVELRRIYCAAKAMTDLAEPQGGGEDQG